MIRIESGTIMNSWRALFSNKINTFMYQTFYGDSTKIRNVSQAVDSMQYIHTPNSIVVSIFSFYLQNCLNYDYLRHLDTSETEFQWTCWYPWNLVVGKESAVGAWFLWILCRNPSINYEIVHKLWNSP